MRLTNIEIKGLFGRYDYNIPLDMPIKIIYGTNGTGKTTILRIVNAILNLPKKDAWEQLKKEIFEFCTLTFDSGEMATVRSNDELPPALNTKEKLTPFFIRTNRDYYFFKLKAEITNEKSEEIVLIQNIFKDELERKRVAYYKKKFDLEQDEKNKKSKGEYPQIGDFDELVRRSERLNEQLNFFVQIGMFADKSDLSFIQIPTVKDEFNKISLSFEVEKQTKLVDFFNEDNFYERLRSFFEIINEEKLWYKTLKADATKGLKVEVLDKKGKTKSIPLKSLSSGEQQLLALFYMFFFKIPTNAIVLIDEPEISWHIGWQKDFLGDLQKINQLTGATFLVATHAPNIINGQTQLTISLDAQNRIPR